MFETNKNSRNSPKPTPSPHPLSTDLGWVDTFIKNVAPYIYVRTEDNLLIKRPNHAVKVNRTGALVLHELLKGTPIAALLSQLEDRDQKAIEIGRFMDALKAQLEGNLSEFTNSPAVETTPFHKNFSPYPVLSEAALTYRCNLRCRFCYAGCNCTSAVSTGAPEMNKRGVKKILRRLIKQARVPSVSFTGGEPLLVPQLPDYIAYAKKLGMRVNLITNGTLIDESTARRLAAAGLDSAQVSLEGVTPETHDDIVRVPGAFARTVSGVKNLKAAGIHTHTNTTITSVNLKECVSFPAFVKETFGNDKFSMNLIIPTGSGALDDALTVKYVEIGPHLERILAESKRRGVEFMWYSPVPMCMFNSITHGLGNKGCAACDGLISIAANGDVLPCASCADPVGNLLKSDFKTIWQSPKAQRYHTKGLAHALCQACTHFDVCQGACPLYWQHMGYEELTDIVNQKKEILIRS